MQQLRDIPAAVVWKSGIWDSRAQLSYNPGVSSLQWQCWGLEGARAIVPIH